MVRGHAHRPLLALRSPSSSPRRLSARFRILSRAMGYDADTYWGRQGLERKIIDALAATGKDIGRLTIDDLAPADQFHSGGKNSTVRLARLAGLKPGMRVLDVGGGLGGPARTLAAEFDCQVTVVDATESYVRTGEALTARLRLTDRVTHRVGDALALNTVGGVFDVVRTRNSGRNIAAKGPRDAGL